MNRDKTLLLCAEMLRSGHNVEILGDHGSGRTRLLENIRSHLATIGWTTITLSGASALRRSSLSSLALSGLLEHQEGRTAPLVAAFSALERQVTSEQTAIVIDDVDHLDDASWGVLVGVSARQGAPMVVTRLRAGTMPVHETAFYTVTVGPIHFGELEDIIEARFSSRIEGTTASRVYAKAGGNVGLALAIVDTALRLGRIVAENGMLRATGSLWTPLLSGVVDTYLSMLEPDELADLGTLALLGPIDFATAARAVSQRSILTLEKAGALSVIETRDSRLVAVEPPIVADYFRDEALPGQRLAAMIRIEETLAESAPLYTAHTHSSTPTFVRLAREFNRRRTLRSQEEWRRTPDLSNAAALLAALDDDPASTSDDAHELAEIASFLPGSSRQRAEWAIALSSHLIARGAALPEAIHLLADAAASIPTAATWMHARQALLTIEHDRLPSDEPSSGTDITRLSNQERSDVIAAKALWALAAGYPMEAEQLLTEAGPIDGHDSLIDLVQVYATIARGRISAAYSLARSRLEEARTAFDIPRYRSAAFLAAYSGAFLRQFDETIGFIDEAVALGAPRREPITGALGVTLASAYQLVNGGNRDFADQSMDAAETITPINGPLPGLQSAMVLARAAVMNGDPARASHLCRRSADELWERGYRFAAANLYLYGLRIHPDPAEWGHAKPRIGQLDIPLITRWAQLSDALVRRDWRATLSSIRTFVDDGEPAHAAQLAAAALRALGSAERDDDRAVSAELSDLRDRTPYAPSSTLNLSEREREVGRLVVSGLTNPQIASALLISTRTVESHINKLLRKTGAAKRDELRELFT